MPYLSTCAEHVAVTKAVSEGFNLMSAVAIALYVMCVCLCVCVCVCVSVCVMAGGGGEEPETTPSFVLW